jgi:hypothetical protein
MRVSSPVIQPVLVWLGSKRVKKDEKFKGKKFN